MSKIIAFVNRKGGSAKSTSCAFIATCLHNSGKSVACIDYDGEQSLIKWHSTEALPFDVVAGSEDIEKDISSLDVDYILLDTPPNNEAIVLNVCSVADEVIIPLSPTAMDANRLLTTLRNVSTIEKLRKQPLTSVLITKTKPNTKLLTDIKEMLAERDVPLLDATISHSVKYQDFDTPKHLVEYQAVIDELGL